MPFRRSHEGFVFGAAEWKGLYLAIYRKAFANGKDMPTEPPTLSMAVIWLARLGGFLGVL